MLISLYVVASMQKITKQFKYAFFWWFEERSQWPNGLERGLSSEAARDRFPT